MIRVNLYKKLNTYFNLLVGTELEEKINMPLYNTDITLWKGVDNTIEFSIRNHDRKSVAFDEGTILKFVAINQPLQQKIEKELEVINSALGRYKVTLTNKELKDYDIGTFIGHVSIVDAEENEELLYSGTDWYPHFNVEIKPNKMDLVDESVTMLSESFNREVLYYMGREIEYVTSPIFKADRSAHHTMLMKLKDFDGIVKLQASSFEQPSTNASDWCDICVRNYMCDFPSADEGVEDIIPSEPQEPSDETDEDIFYVDDESYTLDELNKEVDELHQDEDCEYVTIVDEETGQTYILPKEEVESTNNCCCNTDGNQSCLKPICKDNYPYHNYHPFLVIGPDNNMICPKPNDNEPKKPEPFNGTIILNGTLNCLWVRVQYIKLMDSESSIEEITYHN
jgi:hypothetical protein